MVKELAGNEPSDRSNNVCSPSNNMKYKGVRKRKWGKYVSEIRLPNSRERIWLGSYDTAEKAARAFDAAQFCLRGSTANFNFPNNTPVIVGATSMNSSEIQLAAARFAHSEPLPTESGRIGNVDVTMSCSTSSKSDPSNLRIESPSPSVTADEFSVSTEFTNIPLDNAYLQSDLMGSECNLINFGMFPGFDEFFVPSVAGVNLEEDNCEGYSNSHDSYLWNF